MDVLQGKKVAVTFLGVKADRNPLYYPDIIDGTFFVKICQSNVSGILINVDRRDGCRYFLNQTKITILVNIICAVDKSSKVDPRNPLECHVAIIILS